MAETPVFVVTPEGVKAASLAENVETLNDRQRAAFGEDLALSPATPQAQWSGVVGIGLTEVGEEGGRAAVYGSSVDHAQGVHLDAIGSVADVRRLQATHSRVVATLTGVAGTEVSAGSRAKTAAGDEFATESGVILSPAGVDVVMRAVVAGPVMAAVGAIDTIVTGIEGWETVTNAAAATVGRAKQDDEIYRGIYRARTAHSSLGPLDGLRAALIEAGASTRTRVIHNPTNAAVVNQGWTVPAHSILAVVDDGLDTDMTRAVENHRGMGAGTLTAIVGAAPSDFSGITTGPVEWDGVAFAGLNLTSAIDNANRATALTTHLATASRPPTIHWTGNRFVAQYVWVPDADPPAFGTGAIAVAFGLDADSAAAAPGPFVRPVNRALAVAVGLTLRPGFPGDGLNDIRAALIAIADAYPIGSEVWDGDFRAAAEGIAGTRITSIGVTAGGTNVSAVAADLVVKWTLATGDITITVT